MLGPPKSRNLDRPVLISLEASVPEDHFYRYLERTLDLAFVRDLAADCYASSGRPSIDPVVFFKLHLVMFFEGVRSERKLIEIASLNLAHRCGCPLGSMGHNLDEPPPDHSSLSKIRTRLGLPVFRRFFEVIVEQCVHAGLVWGKELIIDATNTAQRAPGANAAMESLIPVLRLVVDRQVRLRGLMKVNMEGVFIAAGQNLKRLSSATGWGRRPWPDGAAGCAGLTFQTALTWR